MRRVAVVALVHACLGIATAVVAVGCIGVETLADRARLAALALEDPTAIVVQDGFKFASALTAVLLAAVWYRLLRAPTPRLAVLASVMGVLWAVLLVGNGGASLAGLGRLWGRRARAADSVPASGVGMIDVRGQGERSLRSW